MNTRPLLSSLTCLAMVAGACNLQAAGIGADKQLNYPDYSRKSGDLVISRSAYAEKFEGFWLGECIANWTGLRTEGVKKTAPFFTDKDWGTNQGRNRQKIEFVLVEEEMYDFIRKDYQDNPDKDNWEKTRDALNRRHTGVTTDGYNYRSWFDAGINYGASLVSLFYGQGDFKRTIRIGALCGWDSDNPTATWGGLLGFLLGREGVEKAFPDKKLSGLYNISRTRINFPDRTPDQPGDDSFALMAERGIHIIDRVVIEEMGGEIDLEKDTWLIPGSGFKIKAAQSE